MLVSFHGAVAVAGGVALDESEVVVPALRTWSFPCGCARVQGGQGAGVLRGGTGNWELGTGDGL